MPCPTLPAGADDIYRTVFRTAAVGLARVCPDGTFIEVNDRVCAITGYPREEMEGMRFQTITHPDDLEADLEHARDLLAGRSQSYAMDKRYLRKDGSVVWVRLAGSLIRDEGGKPDYFVAVVEDITDSKAAEQHNQMLLAELNHRVRNSLAIVQHFARHAFRSLEDGADAMKAFEQRLMALAEAHTLLTTAQWEPVSLEELIGRTVTAACGSADRFVLSGPLVVLPPKTAVTMSLALHEMCTNAVKYGALSVDGGTVYVTWEVLAADTSQFRLTWREEGGPQVTPPEQAGFGTRMIRQALAHEFQGGVDLAFHRVGLVCTLTGKLPAVIEARP